MRAYVVRSFWKVVGLALAFGLTAPVAAQTQPDYYYPKPHTGLFPTPHRPPENSVRNRQLRNMKTWTLAMIQHLQDVSNVYPEMKSAPAVKAILWPSIVANKGGLDPVTHRLYLPNPYLSHKSFAAVSDPARTVLFYEAQPNADGTRAVGFVDGHCALILNQEWPRLKKLSHLP